MVGEGEGGEECHEDGERHVDLPFSFKEIEESWCRRETPSRDYK